MPPAKKLAKKSTTTGEASSSSVLEITKDIRSDLLNYFSNDEIDFMLGQSYISKNPRKPSFQVSLEYIDDNFINIYPLKLYSKNFQEDFKKAIYKLFETSLFDDMKQKEQDEIIFLTTKPQTTKTMKCPRCQSYQTKIMDKQLRSGDEGSDVILECESCGLKKKINSIILE